MKLDERGIEQIVDMVINRLQKEGVELSDSDSSPNPSNNAADGVFHEIEDAIQAASIAQKKLLSLPLKTREGIIQAIRNVGKTNAEDYGRMEFEETGLGKLEDNIQKNQAACQVMGMEDLVPEVFHRLGHKG